MTFDLDWRYEKDGVTWRLAVPDDMPRLRELWASMDKKLGHQDKPNLFAMPVVITLVAERDGVIVLGCYGECVVDFTLIGLDRKATVTVNGLFEDLRTFLMERTIRAARVLVPRRLAKGMKQLLPQMDEITDRFAQFVCVLSKRY